MIQFKVKELTAPTEATIFPHAFVLFNTAATGLANALQERHGDHCCEFHPDAENIYTIIPNEQGNMTLEYTKVCCEHFADMITFASEA